MLIIVIVKVDDYIIYINNRDYKNKCIHDLYK